MSVFKKKKKRHRYWGRKVLRYGPEVKQKSCGGAGRKPRSLKPLSACPLSFDHSYNTRFTSSPSLGLTVPAVFEEERWGKTHSPGRDLPGTDQVFIENQGAFGPDPSGTFTPQSWTMQPSLSPWWTHSLQNFLGWSTYDPPWWSWADDFGTLNMPVVMFAPCLGGFPASRECTDHPRLTDMKLNPAAQLHNSFLSVKVRSHLDVQTHMSPPHFQQEEITLPSASWELINQINLSQQ